MFDVSNSHVTPASVEEVVTVVQDITRRCFVRWDNFFGIRPASSEGIWRPKFDGVRGSTMLLAFCQLNATIGKLDPGKLAKVMS